jgi:hypothetical protein
MAAHGHTEYSTAPGNDLPAHEQTYDKFVFLVTIGICQLISIAVGLAIGGVKGAWWTAMGVFLASMLVAIHGLATGSKTPSYVMVVLALLALALA